MSLGACNSSLFIPFIATVCPNRKPISVLRALQQSPKSVAALIRIRLTAWKKLADICFFLSEIPYPILWWIVLLLTISYTVLCLQKGKSWTLQPLIKLFLNIEFSKINLPIVLFRYISVTWHPLELDLPFSLCPYASPQRICIIGHVFLDKHYAWIFRQVFWTRPVLNIPQSDPFICRRIDIFDILKSKVRSQL